MRKALLVGINDYPKNPLNGCINDAQNMYNILSKNDDMSPNFFCKLLISSNTKITADKLKGEIRELFKFDSDDVALLYFSGHGFADDLGGFLVTQDAKKNAVGVSLNDVITLANESSIREIIIILDCCHSEYVGNTINGERVLLKKGVSILASSRKDQLSVEEDDKGLFTSIVCNALEGAAADILGNVTVASIYSFADQLLSPWNQRPIFKTYVSKMISLRKCAPKINFGILRRITEYFKTPKFQFPLDPSFEPTAEPRNVKSEKIFSELQKLTSLNLVEPVDEEHMYFAAINNKSCQLTSRGRFYWKMIEKSKI